MNLFGQSQVTTRKKILGEREHYDKHRNLRKSFKLIRSLRYRVSNDRSTLELNNVKLKEIWKATILHGNVPCTMDSQRK